MAHWGLQGQGRDFSMVFIAEVVSNPALSESLLDAKFQEVAVDKEGR